MIDNETLSPIFLLANDVTLQPVYLKDISIGTYIMMQNTVHTNEVIRTRCVYMGCYNDAYLVVWASQYTNIPSSYWYRLPRHDMPMYIDPSTRITLANFLTLCYRYPSSTEISQLNYWPNENEFV